MKLIGVTGNIASGKSTVSKIIAKQYLNCPLVSVDDFSRGYISTYPLLIATCFRAFGLSYQLDNLVDNIKESFTNVPFRKHLEGVIGAAFWRYMQYGEVQKHPIIVVEHPLMFEVADADDFDFIIGVTANVKVRLDRMHKRGYTADTILQRLEAQIPLAQNKNNLDLLIDTSEYPTHEDIIQQIQNSKEFTEFVSETALS